MSSESRFLPLWSRYFPGAELPLGFYYTDTPPAPPTPRPAGRSCVICELGRARRGETLVLGVDNIACRGGRRYLGFPAEMGEDFDHFLSCGIPGKLEGERYKKTPQIVHELMAGRPLLVAPARHIVWKRWDMMAEGERPEVVVWFAPPDVLAGLFTLANYDVTHADGVIAPFGSGCAGIVDRPYREGQSPEPRAVLGMFDVSARPCVEPGVLSFAVPWRKLTAMIENMEESFLITRSWEKVAARIERAAGRRAEGTQR